MEGLALHGVNTQYMLVLIKSVDLGKEEEQFS